jgi:hypothetical protein
MVRAFNVAKVPRPANLPSTPEAWTRVAFPSSRGDEVLSITAGGPGMVAVGADGYGFEYGGPAVWASRDARTWTRVYKQRGNGRIYDVTAGGPGLVAVGTQFGTWPSGAGDSAPVWTSSDGLTWTEAPPDPVFEGAWMRAVVVGGPGLIAVGSTLDGPAAWFSADGVTWDRASVPPSPPDVAHDGRQAEAWMLDVAVAGDRLVAVGQIGIEVGPNAGRYFPAIWTSTDGMTWTEISLDQDVFPSEIEELPSVAAGPGGFVAVGGIYSDTPMAWQSEDGLNWQRVSAGQKAFVSQASGRSKDAVNLQFGVHSVAAGSEGYVAMGGDAWCEPAYRFLCSPAQAAAWVSKDGASWVRVPTAPVFQVGKTTRVEISAVTTWGSRFVASGRYGDEIAIWISEPSEG